MKNFKSCDMATGDLVGVSYELGLKLTEAKARGSAVQQKHSVRFVHPIWKLSKSLVAYMKHFYNNLKLVCKN